MTVVNRLALLGSTMVLDGFVQLVVDSGGLALSNRHPVRDLWER